MVTQTGDHVCDTHVEVTVNPDPTMMIKAKLMFRNKVLFDYIQEFQRNKKSLKKVFTHIKELDKLADEDFVPVIKVKNRIIRNELTDEIVRFKKQIAKVYSVMRAYEEPNLNMNAHNVLIAELNDVAYRGIRKTGLQKQLDARALKNEDYYKKLDLQVEKEVDKIDFSGIESKYKKTSDIIGNCPVSQ